MRDDITHHGVYRSSRRIVELFEDDQIIEEEEKKEDLADFGEMEESKDESTKNKDLWKAKVAYFLCYCVDGGILSQRFTLRTLISQFMDMGETNQKAQLLHDEILYLLQIRKQRDGIYRADNKFAGLSQYLVKMEEETFYFNEKVMAVLLEFGYI